MTIVARGIACSKAHGILQRLLLDIRDLMRKEMKAA
jgi:hypothetical protein